MSPLGAPKPEMSPNSVRSNGNSAPANVKHEQFQDPMGNNIPGQGRLLSPGGSGAGPQHAQSPNAQTNFYGGGGANGGGQRQSGGNGVSGPAVSPAPRSSSTGSSGSILERALATTVKQEGQPQQQPGSPTAAAAGNPLTPGPQGQQHNPDAHHFTWPSGQQQQQPPHQQPPLASPGFDMEEYMKMEAAPGQPHPPPHPPPPPPHLGQVTMEYMQAAAPGAFQNGPGDERQQQQFQVQQQQQQQSLNQSQWVR